MDMGVPVIALQKSAILVEVKLEGSILGNDITFGNVCADRLGWDIDGVLTGNGCETEAELLPVPLEGEEKGELGLQYQKTYNELATNSVRSWYETVDLEGKSIPRYKIRNKTWRNSIRIEKGTHFSGSELQDKDRREV